MSQRTAEQLAAFNEIAKALTSTLEVREVLQLVMQKVSELLRPRNWSLILKDEQADSLYFEIAVGEGADKLKQLRLSPEEGIAGEVFRSGQPRLVPDVGAEPNFAHRFDEASAFQTHSILAVPLVFRGRGLGVIELVNGVGDRPFTEDDLQATIGLADFAAIAIENARNFRRVQELTLTDDHTALFNARHLSQLLEQEVARSKRFGHPLSLLFIDLDHFKEVNDGHGHLVGSALLREVGDLLLSEIRQVDSAFRYGGDEFAILLIETEAAGAEAAARRILEAIQRRVFLASQGLQLKLTASIGSATFPDHATDATALLRAADRAMYQAKALGRDRAFSAGP